MSRLQVPWFAYVFSVAKMFLCFTLGNHFPDKDVRGSGRRLQWFGKWKQYILFFGLISLENSLPTFFLLLKYTVVLAFLKKTTEWLISNSGLDKWCLLLPEGWLIICCNKPYKTFSCTVNINSAFQLFLESNWPCWQKLLGTELSNNRSTDCLFLI